jgi:transglutaminase-like putative cysteine protease
MLSERTAMTVHYRVAHTTTYAYGSPVSVCHNLVCLTPRPGPRLAVHNPRLTITPRPTTSMRRFDSFGNTVHVFSIESAHDRLVVSAWARVSVAPAGLPQLTPTTPWERVVERVDDQSDPQWADAAPFAFDSPRVRRSREARAFARRAFTPGRPVLDAARALNTLIHKEFAYRPGQTHVQTDSDAALKLRAGVCQDFAHVQLACLRSLGLPARYVSGYLRTNPPPGRPRLVGADQSHAWVGVYGGPELGWVDLDPTNNMVCDTDHITLAWGRDYTDVAPVRGVFLGGGESELTVRVEVEPVGSDAAVAAEATDASDAAT